jgi:hypothetical protein
VVTGHCAWKRKGDTMSEAQTATIQTDVPVRLLTEMQTLVEAGWFRDLDELMLNAFLSLMALHPDAILLNDDAASRLAAKGLC